MARSPKKAATKNAKPGRETLPRSAKDASKEKKEEPVIKASPKKVKEAKTKVAKKKKTATKKKSKPTYEAMIKKALLASTENLQSIKAIAKFLEANYPLPENYKHYLKQGLAIGVAHKTFIKVKASYRLSAKASKKSRGRKTVKRATTEPASTPKKTKKATAEKKAKRTKSPSKKVDVEAPAKKKKRTTKNVEEALPKKTKKTAKKARTSASNENENSESGGSVTITGSKYDHVWQYHDGSWKSYDVKASDTVEETYLKYLENRGETDVRAVHSGQWEYQVDFMAMKQTNIQHENHTTRNIRRMPNAK